MWFLYKMRLNVIWALALVAVFLFGSNAGSATSFPTDKCFTIGYAQSESGVVAPYKAPMRHVYNNLGHCVVYLELPYKRLMKMVSSNKIDAIMGRSLPAILNYPDLPYVPTAVVTFKAYLVTSPEAAESVKKDIANLPLYNIGGLSGADWAMQTLNMATPDFRYTENIDQLISMYIKHRLDGLLVNELQLPYVMGSLSKSNDSAYQTVLLYDVPVYHVLAPKHVDMVAQLDASVNNVLALLAGNPNVNAVEQEGAL
tara:strand:+ start:38178 stop:38945 length:768 start_codon:yes stop_codon:yes gene_type:complete